MTLRTALPLAAAFAFTLAACSQQPATEEGEAPETGAPETAAPQDPAPAEPEAEMPPAEDDTAAAPQPQTDLTGDVNLVASVDSVSVTSTGGEGVYRITATGTVRTGGWSEPALTDYGQTATVLSLAFVAVPPDGMATQVISPITASRDIGPLPDGIETIRVYGDLNFIEVPAAPEAPQPPAEPQAAEPVAPAPEPAPEQPVTPPAPAEDPADHSPPALPQPEEPAPDQPGEPAPHDAPPGQ